MIKWFAANNLGLNLDKTNIMKHVTKNSLHSTLYLYIGYKGKYIEETVNTKFLGLQINNHINWKNHVKEMIRKFRGTSYAIMSVVHVSNIDILKSMYYAYFHSFIQDGIVPWGNSSNSGKIFTLQKKIVRIMAGTQPRTSCRSLVKQLEILPVPCQYILSLMNFIVNNQKFLQTNLSMHNINTRNKHHLRRPHANLSCLQKSTFCAGIKIFNTLPPSATVLENDKAKFKAA